MLQYNRKIFILWVLSCIPVFATAQNSTYSPYTRFGWGRLSDNVIGGYRSMGGTSIGIRSSHQINPSNPASYYDLETSYDNLGGGSFLFDFGVHGSISNFRESGNKEDFRNGGLDHILMAFPVSSKIVVSAGLTPFSSTGYSFSMVENLQYPNGGSSGILAQHDYKGSGDLSQVYVGAAFNLMTNLSVGLNVNYLFGSTENERIVSYPNSSSFYFVERIQKIKVSDVNFKLGLLYTHKLSNKEHMTLGLTFSPKKKMNTSTSTNTYMGTGSTTDSTLITRSNAKFDLPNSFGIGLSYNYDNRLTVGGDFEYQAWKNAKYYNKTDTLNNWYKASLGAEFIPSLRGRNYFQTIRYRAGIAYERSYVNVNGASVNAYHATAGFGFPFRSNGGMLNLGFEYMHIPSTRKNNIEENNYKVTLSIVFSERWFRKMIFN